MHTLSTKLYSDYFCCNVVSILHKALIATLLKVSGEFTHAFPLKEADTGVRWISVLTNVADQLYYPCEHIAWAADAELIKVKSDKWWLLCTVLWGSSLLLGILRCDISFHQTANIKL